jgi:hypothetical protein
MLYREIITVCSEIHTKHINTLCEQNVEFVNVKLDGIYNNHWALNVSVLSEHRSGICYIELQNQRVVLNDPWHIEILVMSERILFRVKITQIIIL